MVSDGKGFRKLSTWLDVQPHTIRTPVGAALNLRAPLSSVPCSETTGRFAHIVKCARILGPVSWGGTTGRTFTALWGVHAWLASSSLGGPLGRRLRVGEVRAHIVPGKLGAATPTAFIRGPGGRPRLTFAFLPQRFHVCWWYRGLAPVSQANSSFPGSPFLARVRRRISVRRRVVRNRAGAGPLIFSLWGAFNRCGCVISSGNWLRGSGVVRVPYPDAGYAWKRTVCTRLAYLLKRVCHRECSWRRNWPVSNRHCLRRRGVGAECLGLHGWLNLSRPLHLGRVGGNPGGSRKCARSLSARDASRCGREPPRLGALQRSLCFDETRTAPGPLRLRKSLPRRGDRTRASPRSGR